MGESVLKRFAPILWLMVACWVMFVVNNLLLRGHLTTLGIHPRHLTSLPGIIWAPLLHGSFAHLAANTVPLLVLGGILCVRGKAEFVTVAVAGTLLGGLLTWAFARNGSHVGASGLIFCFFGYLASLAIFKRTLGTLCLSLACVVLYGGMLKGVLPRSAFVSWEGHAAGLLVGVAFAWVASKLEKTTEPQPVNSAQPVTTGKP